MGDVTATAVVGVSLPSGSTAVVVGPPAAAARNTILLEGTVANEPAPTPKRAAAWFGVEHHLVVHSDDVPHTDIDEGGVVAVAGEAPASVVELGGLDCYGQGQEERDQAELEVHWVQMGAQTR